MTVIVLLLSAPIQKTILHARVSKVTLVTGEFAMVSISHDPIPNCVSGISPRKIYKVKQITMSYMIYDI